MKIVVLCVMTLVSNLVWAAETRGVSEIGKSQRHQLKRVPAKPKAASECVAEKSKVLEPSVASEPILKQESPPEKMMAPPFELKGVRG
ncbi:MAG: hypothetical protein PHP57_03425 [Sideroxydans sp.]|nr:hypothetical protein [Sideroxydans sp.]